MVGDGKSVHLVLYAILSDDGAVGGGVVFGEIAEVGTQLGQEDFGKTEFEVEIGVHIEPGPNGGIVVLDDPTIYDMAVEILKEQEGKDA